MSTSFAGQLGKVAVIGGSQDYTGAPYFSATASACLGCDMVSIEPTFFGVAAHGRQPNYLNWQSHVICTPEAGSVIKSYSPNLMVHPLMRESLTTDPRSGKVNADADAIANNIADIFSKFHVLVIGPGLGQDDLMLATVTRVLQMARERNVPVVLDADALLVVQKHFRLIRGYKQAILTPNAMEFKQLCKAANVEVGNNNDETGTVERLARELGGVTVLRKGAEDVISNGEITLINTGEGGKKRSGGQGDTLTGSTATFLAWRKAYTDRLWEDSADGRLTEEHMIVLAAFGGSTITRVRRTLQAIEIPTC